ncbi:MAG: hypothetical protein J6S83_13820, partial [Lachnospiraceae bacterium]|nr:hypothetical protein [Lachnospiraceae bacterium]
PDIGSQPVPAMILQPLVENAITHGIREMMDRGVVTLSAAREEAFIRVTVKDNGVDMSADQITEIYAKAGFGSETPPGNDPDEALPDENGQEEIDSTGIGLENVIRRLQLFYNRDGLLTIRSEGHMRGTEITLLLPV